MDAARLKRIAEEELAKIRSEIGDRVPLVSDFIDRERHQYVDVVLEGAFYRSIALVGYVYALEDFGIRFLSIAGTSSGANIATLLAAAGKPHERRAAKVLDAIVTLRTSDAYDQKRASQRRFADWLTAAPPAGRGLTWPRTRHALAGIAAALPCAPALFWHLGVFPGNAYQAWVERALHGFGITRADELIERMQPDDTKRIGMRSGDGGGVTIEQPTATLCVVATDVSTERRVQFPRDGKLYFADPDAVNPAVWVRASISLPLLYRPVICRPPYGSRKAWEEPWPSEAGRAAPPPRCVLVDGGVISNFPIDVFHEHRPVPRGCPTLGVRVSRADRYSEVRGLGKLARQIFDTARRAIETSFLAEHPDYKFLVRTIDATGMEGSAFAATDAQTEWLFRNGIRAAGRWLGEFDWERYKLVRAGDSRAQSSRSGVG